MWPGRVLFGSRLIYGFFAGDHLKNQKQTRSRDPGSQRRRRRMRDMPGMRWGWRCIRTRARARERDQAEAGYLREREPLIDEVKMKRNRVSEEEDEG